MNLILKLLLDAFLFVSEGFRPFSPVHRIPLDKSHGVLSNDHDV